MANYKKMKKEYIKPGIIVEQMDSIPLLVGSNNDPYDQHNNDPYDQHNSSHIPIYPGDDDTIDEDDVI
jgi:hypothetical protein